MPSSASPSVLAELQAAGENLNTWGAPRLNTALSMHEAASHGLSIHTLTANRSLTYINYTATDGTDYVQLIAAASDGSYTLTVGGYERSYLIWNASSYDQIIACSGGGTSVTVYAGEVVPVYCDATNMTRLDYRYLSGDLDAGGFKITDLAAPTLDMDAATKKYVDDEILDASLSGETPVTTGNAGRFLAVKDDETGLEWANPVGESVDEDRTLTVRNRPYYAALTADRTWTLPASPDSDAQILIETGPDVGTHTLTLDRNGNTIMGLSEDMDVTRPNIRFRISYTGSDWRVTA